MPARKPGPEDVSGTEPGKPSPRPASAQSGGAHIENSQVEARDIAGHDIIKGPKIDVQGDLHVHYPATAELPGVKIHKPGDIKEYLEARIAEWSQPRYQIDTRFVNLTLLLDQGEDAQGARWAAPEGRRFDDLREVLKARPDDPALVLLGAPGSGKSTLLRRFQLDTAEDTLRGGQNQDDDLVTFFLPLNSYKRDSGNPRDWVNAEWTRLYPGLPRLEELLGAGRVLLLLDALNEMPHASPADYHHRVGLWRDFIQSITRQGNRALFSCRSLDYSASLSSKELRVPQVALQPLDNEQIRAFLQVYVPERAAAAWRQLEGTAQLDLFRAPYFLKLLCEQVKAHNAVPKGRAALFTGFVRQTLEREMLSLDSLLTEKDLLKLNHHKWRDSFELPEAGALVGALGRLAYSMQEKSLKSEGAQVRVAYHQACQLLGGERPEEILKAGVSLNVLDHDLAQDEVLFFHQLLQEFFAARELATGPKPELVRVAWQADKVSPTLKETLATLADSDPLPLLPQTGWEETTLLAAVMARDPAGFITDLMTVNLPLAGRCMASPELPQMPAAPDLKQQIQQALIERTEDLNADLRARIAAGQALGSLGDPRFERRKGPHGDYLLPPLKTIPAGEYPMGSDEGLYNNEGPAHRVRLAAFQIGEFPVTSAEYRLFIEAGGYEDERWWRREAAKAWRRGEGTSEGPKQRWRDDRKTLQGWSEEHIKNLVKQNRITSKQAEDWATIRNWTEERFEAWLEEVYPANKRYTAPGYWNDESFNNQGQPVVGICWHEAWAYCAWLSEQTGQVFRLPTEAEYEAAARGREGRKYAYGEKFDGARSNTFESHIRRTTPVGIFRNATPEGVLDLSGNVYTWASSVYQPYPYVASDGREDLDRAEEPRVVRGGSWDNVRNFARAAFRDFSGPAVRFNLVGFRVVGVVPSP
jgi:formylglycine-generating enzyme required for sulfatase activity